MHDSEHGPGRPEADECLPYYFQYIQLVPDGHVVDILERQITESAAFLSAFTPQQKPNIAYDGTATAGGGGANRWRSTSSKVASS